MNNKTKVKSNLFYSLFSKFTIIMIGLVLPRITMENYGSEINGLLNSAHQMVTYLTLFEAGIQAVAIKALYKPVSENDRIDINGILSAVNIQYRKTGSWYLAGLLFVSAVFGVFIHSDTISFSTAFLLVFFSGAGKVILFFFQGKYKILLQAEGKSYIDANLQTVVSLLTGVIKIILLNRGMNVVVVVASAFVVSLIQSGYIIYLIQRDYRWIDLKCTPNVSALKQKNFALIHQISALVFQNTDILLLTVFCSLETVSVYSIYKLVVMYISSILYTIYDSFNFSLGQKFYSDRECFVQRLDLIEVYYTAITFAIYTVTYALFQPFVSLYTQGIQDASYLDRQLPLLFVSVELLSVCRIPLLNTINYAGHFKETTSRTILETIVNLTISVVTVSYMGIHGVLIGTAAALLFRNVDMILYVNHRIIKRPSWRTLKTHLINGIVFILIVIVLRIVEFNVLSFGAFVLAGCLLVPFSLFIYIGVQAIFHKETVPVVLKLIKDMKIKYKI